MDFSTEFVALRDRLIETQDKAFRTQTNVEVAGRMAALCSSFTIKSERKILGLMPTAASATRTNTACCLPFRSSARTSLRTGGRMRKGCSKRSLSRMKTTISPSFRSSSPPASWKRTCRSG